MRAPPLKPVVRWLRSVRPDPGTFRNDVVAGLPGAIGSVPDGMAAGVLAGVNPVFGLYASFAGPIAGGLSASTKLMVVGPTSAAALAAGSVLMEIDPGQREDALFLLVLIAGAAMILAGVARLGRYVRFVSHSVMTGFLTGIAANIVFSQIPDLAGAEAEGGSSLAKAVDVLIHPGEIDVASLVIGLSALAIIVVFARTRLSQVATLIALVVPTVIVFLVGSETVALVEDVGSFPRGVPLPGLPGFGALSLPVVTGALAVAAIVLVQGAGVAESAPNPDGTRGDANTDFVAQGAGNVASGLFMGLPVGGSVSNTALNRAAGARGRWASIASGVWMILILVAFSGLVGKVALPTLAAVLIYAAVGTVKPREVLTILRTGPTSLIAAVTTFVATLFLPIQVAVAIGVALSLLLQLNREAMDLKVVELVPQPDGSIRERRAPERLASNSVTALDVYGSLLYAGSRTLQARLPDPAGTTKPVVILRLRGRTELGATFFVIIAGYARRLAEVGGRLYLSGMDPELMEQMSRTGRVDVTGPVRVYEATETIGESTRAAYEDAQAWLVRHQDAEDEE